MTAILSPISPLPTTRVPTKTAVVSAKNSNMLAHPPAAVVAVAQARIAKREFSERVTVDQGVSTGRVFSVVLMVFVLISITVIGLAAWGESVPGGSIVPDLDSLVRLLAAAYLG